MSKFQYLDSEDRELHVGDRVLTEADEEPGVIIQILEAETDYNDAIGRPQTYGPFVVVKWPEFAEAERFSGYPELVYPENPTKFHFSDLMRVADEKH